MVTHPALPLEAGALIPHRPPMQLIRRLVALDGAGGTAEAVVSADGLLTEEDGSLHPAALVELIAQAYAAVKGYRDLVKGLPAQMGFLVGIRAVRFTGRALRGEALRVRVQATVALQGFVLVEGEVQSDRGVVASGSIKLYIPEEQAPGGGDP
jgi:predicted hotdog family 3-hydroxylacyl-ACP dehydratase